MSNPWIPSSSSGASGAPTVGTKPASVGFLGLSLAGGKTDKACLSLLEYYPDQKRLFLSKIFEKIKSDSTISADLKIHEIIMQYQAQTKTIAVDIPWKLPLCLSCKLTCPGFENCNADHIQWMWKWSEKNLQPKKPKKVFTPYTQRAAEMYLATELDERIVLPHVMGSNSAPLVARAAFILRRLNIPAIEVHPRLTLWRLGSQLEVQKNHLRRHKHSVSGEDSRRTILAALEEKNLAFVYAADRKLMISNSHAFDSFLCALTAFLEHMGYTEDKPADFPKDESWINFPVKNVPWNKILLENK
ncbi:MAG: DUF429 domain-containing protein [Bdellovibrionota bacterium]